jgi:hypothetical protein
LSKPLDQLDASKAGVSQAELEEAFLSLATLEEENAAEEVKLEAVIEAKKKARAGLDKATEKVREALAVRDPVAEEWARAAWIVRNADPDQPPPPLGNRPPRISSVRAS